MLHSGGEVEGMATMSTQWAGIIYSAARHLGADRVPVELVNVHRVNLLLPEGFDEAEDPLA